MTLLGSAQFSPKASLDPHHSQIFVLSSATTMTVSPSWLLCLLGFPLTLQIQAKTKNSKNKV